jgi:hypothetical protein
MRQIKELSDSKAALIKKISDRETKFYGLILTGLCIEEKSCVKELRDLTKSVYWQLDGNLYDRHFMLK